MNIDYIVFTKNDRIPMPIQQGIATFLHHHLEAYGDPLVHILKAIDYAIGDHPLKGGFVVLAKAGEEIVGAVVVNHTNMGGYIPENILVYIAVNAAYRGQGIGKQLMQRSIDFSTGDIALHVEPDNPALKLYERIGFTNKYLEMRFAKNE